MRANTNHAPDARGAAGATFGRGGIALLLAHGTAAVLAFAWSVLAARLLEPEAFGDYATAVSIATVLAALWPFALITAQLSSRFASRNQWGKIAGLLQAIRGGPLSVSLGLAVAIAAALVLLREPLHYRTAGPLAATAMLWLALALSSIPKSTLRSLAAWGPYGWIVVLDGILRLTIGAGVLLVFPSATAAVAGWVVASTVVGILALRVALRRLPAPIPIRLHPRRLSSLVMPAVLVLGLSGAWQFADLLVVRARFGSEASGIFGAAHAIGRGILVVGMTLDALFVPLLSRAGFRGAPAVATVQKLFLGYAAAALPFFVLIALKAEMIVVLLFGSTYAAAAAILLPVAAASFFTYGSAVMGQGFLALHAFRTPLVWAALLVPALLLMAIAPGIQQVAWVSAIASATAFGTMILLGFRRIRA